MRKSIVRCACLLAFALSLSKAHAQTGIAINDNNATADASAMLDVSVSAAAKKGFLLPRVTTTERDAISLPAKGLLVYVTNVDSLEINMGTPASPVWAAIATGSNWLLKGNAGTNPANNFLGSTDAVDVALRTNSVERLRVTSGGNMGIGTTTPGNKLTVVATNPLALYGVQLGTQTVNDSVLTIKSGIVTKLPLSAWTGWTVTGNTGTTAGTNFVGTTDAKDLVFKTNNVENMRIKSAGNMGIGTTTPGNKLTVVATNPLALYGVQTGTTTTTDSVLTIKNGVVSKLNVSNFGAFTGWNLNGNASTSPGTNFVGTTDNQSLMFKVNNTEAGFIGKNGEGFAISLGSGATTAKWGSTYAVAIGGESQANNASATSVGGKAITAGNATAVGYNANAAQESVSIGSNANSSNNESVAVGASSAVSYQSVVVGKEASSTANNCTVIGFKASATGFQSAAFGANTSATGQNSMVFGNGATVTNNNTVFIGKGTTNILFNDGVYVANRALVVGTGTGNGNGAYLSNGGVWTDVSDKNLKEDFTKLNSAELLSKIMNIEITKWKYKGTNEYHIGPMAQDFYAAFTLGTDDKHISTLDPAGVALVAIQELKKENDALTKKVDDQQKLLEQLLKEVNELKAKVK